MKHRKPNTEDLQQYIYDYGYSSAQQYYHLTDKGINTILFQPQLKALKGTRIDPHYLIDDIVEELLPIDNEYKSTIKNEYNNNITHLSKRIAKEKDIIDFQSMTIEDKLQEYYLRKMIKQSADNNNHHQLNTAINHQTIDNNRKGKLEKRYINHQPIPSNNNIEDWITEDHITQLLQHFGMINNN